MNTKEFSQEFDILYNNIMSNAAPGLDEYEKSVFLTRAQEELVRSIYDGNYNGEPFENTEEIRRFLNNLIKDYSTSEKLNNHKGVATNSIFFATPNDVWFRVYESVGFSDESLGCKNNQTDVIVYPTTYDEYHTIKKNPFRRQNTRRVLRIDLASDVIELISDYNINDYYLRYIVHPDPIILDDLSQYDVSINGITEVTECKLNPAIHEILLKRAVILAKQVWNG